MAKKTRINKQNKAYKKKSTEKIKIKAEMENKVKSNKNYLNLNFWAVGIGVFFFLLYLTTAPRTNVSYADSDELITVGYKLGVAHPSGYSLYTLLVHFFTNLSIIPGTIAFKAHFLSVFLSSFTLAIVFITCSKLIEYLQQKNVKEKLVIISKEWDKLIISGIATFALGFSFAFWLWGEIAEKYSLGNLLISLFLLLIIRLLTENKVGRNWWVEMGIILGLMLWHHQTSVLLMPVLVLALFFKWKEIGDKKEILILGLGFLGIGLVSLISLWWLNSLERNVSWNFEATINGLIGHILRKDFSDTGKVINAYISNSAWMANFSIADFSNYINKTWQYFGAIPLIFIFFGFWFLWRNNKNIFYTVGLGFLICGIVFPTYVTLEVDLSTQLVNTRQYLIGYMFFPLVIAVGILWISGRVVRGLRVLTNNPKYLGITLGLVGLVIASRGIKIYKEVNLRNYDSISKFHKNILESMPKEAILACYSDLACFAFLYSQEVEGIREDVLILPIAYEIVDRKLEKIDDLHGFDYTENPWKTLDYLTWNIDKRPVFLYDYNDSYVDMLGRKYAFTYFVPYGFSSKLTRQIPEKLIMPDYSFAYELQNEKTPKLDLMRKWFKATVSRNISFNALDLLEMGYRSEARENLNIASNLLYQIPEMERERIEAQRESIEAKYPLENKKPGTKVQDEKEMIKTIEILIDQNKFNNAYTGALGAVTINPLNMEARLLLAYLLEIGQNQKAALQEYENVLKYYPDNKEAQEKVIELEILIQDEL